MLLRNKIAGCFLFLSIILLPCVLSAQSKVNQPYSRFGLGEMTSSYLHPYNASMGGVAYTVKKNNIINPFNPASYIGIDTLSFVFDMGLTGNFFTLKDNFSSVNSSNINLSHLLFGFPIFKWWKVSFGILPFSDVSYNSEFTDSTANYGRAQYTHEGDGGINKIYFGSSFAILPNLSAGFNLNFLFGKVDYKSSANFLDQPRSYNSRIQNSIYIKDFSADLGLQYFWNVGSKYEMGAGLTYSFPMSFNVEEDDLLYTYGYSGTREVAIDTALNTKNDIKVNLPQIIGLGISISEPLKWYTGLDITYTDWSNFKVGDRTSPTKNNIRLNLGGEYRPDYRSFNYFKRMTYRAGVHYENNKIVVDDQNLNDMGVHIGFGFPLSKARSQFNLSFEYGKFGTTNHNMIEKDYFRIGISLSAGDTWFMKRNYD